MAAKEKPRNENLARGLSYLDLLDHPAIPVLDFTTLSGGPLHKNLLKSGLCSTPYVLSAGVFSKDGDMIANQAVQKIAGDFKSAGLAKQFESKGRHFLT